MKPQLKNPRYAMQSLTAGLCLALAQLADAQTGGGVSRNGGPVSVGGQPVGVKPPVGHFPYSVGVWRTGTAPNQASFCVKVGAVNTTSAALAQLVPSFGMYVSNPVSEDQCGGAPVAKIGANTGGAAQPGIKSATQPDSPPSQCSRVTWQPIATVLMNATPNASGAIANPKTPTKAVAAVPTSVATYCSSAPLTGRPSGVLFGMYQATTGEFDYHGVPVNFNDTASSAADLSVEVNTLPLRPPVLPRAFGSIDIGNINIPKPAPKN